MAIHALELRTTVGIRSLEGLRRAGPALLPLLGLLMLASAVAVPLALTLPSAGTGTAEAVTPLRVPAGSIEQLDPPAFVPDDGYPRSPDPVAGLAFVRCTNLWIARPDGTGEHRVLAMPGISSPTFSPDARTVAFFADGASGQELWVAAADGSRVLRLGVLTSGGVALAARATNLTWSPDGRWLAFAIRSEGHDPWADGSAIWRLDLIGRDFERLGTGWPAPFWSDGELIAARLHRRDGVLFHSFGKRGSTARRLSSDLTDLSASIAPGWWVEPWEKDVAVVRRIAGGSLSLWYRERPLRRDRRLPAPPAGYSIEETARPTVAEGAPVAITLTGPDGDRDIGIVDPQTGTWTILDYAWEPAWSPAPPAVGPIERQAAAAAAFDLLGTLGRDPERAGILLAEALDPGLLVDDFGFGFGTPVERKRAWAVPANIYGRSEGELVATRLTVRVREVQGRLTAQPVGVAPFRPIRTIDEAVAFLDESLTAEVIPPAGLPAGTRLAMDPLDVWSWGGRTTAELRLSVPTGGGSETLTVSYGDGGFGCVMPRPIMVGNTPGIATRYQVGWPAGRNDWSAPFGVEGQFRKGLLLGVAEAMEELRLAA